MQKWQQWEVASESDWGLAVEREAVIRPLAERPKLNIDDVEDAMRRLRISQSVLYNLLRRYKQRPQTSSLLPWKRGRDKNVTVLAKGREKLLDDCIKDFYLRPERPSLAALILEVRRRFAEQQLPTPNYRTVRRRVEALDLRLVIRKREGAKRAREKLGPVNVSSLRPELPMDVLQIDHTPVDVIVVDAERRLPIGRPWLTLAIDVCTRMVAGFHVSLWAPSALSVSLTLSHAVLSKTAWLADRELDNLTWPAAGLPRLIHVDNGKDFHSEALVRGCQEYGVQLERRPPGQPHFGGHIERSIGTMMGAVHLLPGTTFSNVVEKGLTRLKNAPGEPCRSWNAGSLFRLPAFIIFRFTRHLVGHRWRRGKKESHEESSLSVIPQTRRSSFSIFCPPFRSEFKETGFTFTILVTGTAF
jgi:putative transposase